MSSSGVCQGLALVNCANRRAADGVRDGLFHRAMCAKRSRGALSVALHDTAQGELKMLSLALGVSKARIDRSKVQVVMLLAHTYKRAEASPLLLVTPPLIGCACIVLASIETVL